MKQKLFQLLLISSTFLIIISCKKSMEPIAPEAAKSKQKQLTEKEPASLESGFSRAFSINNSGAIAGSVRNAEGKSFAFILKNDDIWYSGEEVRSNGRPEISFTINDRGDIVGSKISGTGILPMLWRHGQAYALSPLPGQQFGEIFDINNSRLMVGESLNGNFVTPTTMRATVFSLDSDPVDLGTLGGLNASAIAVNDSGHIVGVADNVAGQQRAFVYKGGVMHDLGTLGGTASNANDINEKGEIIGRALLANGAIRAFLYKDGVMQDLGTLGGAASVAFGINDKGEVVGFARISTGQAHAFLYKDGIMYDLGTNGGTESRAYGINNRGDIVGQYTNADGSVHAFIYRDGQMYEL